MIWGGNALRVAKPVVPSPNPSLPGHAVKYTVGSY